MEPASQVDALVVENVLYFNKGWCQMASKWKSVLIAVACSGIAFGIAKYSLNGAATRFSSNAPTEFMSSSGPSQLRPVELGLVLPAVSELRVEQSRLGDVEPAGVRYGVCEMTCQRCVTGCPLWMGQPQACLQSPYCP